MRACCLILATQTRMTFPTKLSMTTYTHSPFLKMLVFAVIIGIAFIDTFTQLDIAIAVLYVVVVMLSATLWPRNVVVVITSLLLGLTIAAHVFSHGLTMTGGPFARCIVSLIAIGITSFLALKGQATTIRLLQREEALHRSQSQLAHVTRVTMLGELAASIAHEVNQPLAAISTNAEASLRWLNRTTPDISEAKTAIENIVRDTARASDVIKKIRAMSRKSDPQYLEIDINDVVEESVSLLQRELKQNDILLNMTLAADLPAVLGDKVQLQQVVINLLVNSMQAMSNNSPAERLLFLRTVRSPSDQVMVEISDTGPGIPADHAHHLFDAFFTTKKEGMGMGLPICRSIIETHGGDIRAVPTDGRGATLQFSLPLPTRKNQPHER